MTDAINLWLPAASSIIGLQGQWQVAFKSGHWMLSTSERRTPKPRVEVSSPGLGKSTGFHSREWNSHSTKWEPPFPTTEHPHHRSGVSLLGWGCPSPGMGCLHSLHRDLPFPATEATHHGYGFPLPCWLTSHQGNGSLHTWAGFLPVPRMEVPQCQSGSLHSSLRFYPMPQWLSSHPLLGCFHSWQRKLPILRMEPSPQLSGSFHSPNGASTVLVGSFPSLHRVFPQLTMELSYLLSGFF